MCIAYLAIVLRAPWFVEGCRIKEYWTLLARASGQPRSVFKGGSQSAYQTLSGCVSVLLTFSSINLTSLLNTLYCIFVWFLWTTSATFLTLLRRELNWNGHHTVTPQDKLNWTTSCECVHECVRYVNHAGSCSYAAALSHKLCSGLHQQQLFGQERQLEGVPLLLPTHHRYGH